MHRFSTIPVVAGAMTKRPSASTDLARQLLNRALLLPNDRHELFVALGANVARGKTGGGQKHCRHGDPQRRSTPAMRLPPVLATEHGKETSTIARYGGYSPPGAS